MSSITLDNFFFNVVPTLYPVSLSSVLSSREGKRYMLKLQSNDRSADIQQVSLYLDSKFSKIEEIEIIASNMKHNFIVNKIEINKNISDSIFNFKIPKDVEEIDTR
jgi:outer membrane lipoprotein-sorting protein